MRKEKKITLDDHLEVTVYELRVKDVLSLMDAAGKEDTGASFVFDRLEMACDLPKNRLDELAFSEIMELWEAFKEVNAVFFDLAAKAGILDQAKTLVEKSLKEAFAESSVPGTPPPPNTGTGFSSPPSKKASGRTPNG